MAQADKRLPNGRFPRGNGAGWGGERKGFVAKKERELNGPGPGRGNYSVEGEGRIERQQRHAEEMRQIYYEFATAEGKEDTIRLKAATHLLDRVEGLPVQKVITAESDPLAMMTDPQLDDEIERTRARAEKLAELRKADEGGASTTS